MRPAKRVLGVAVALCLGGAVLAACSSGKPAASSRRTSSTSTTSTRSTGSVHSSTTTSTSTSTTIGGPTRCRTADLTASVAAGNGAAGTIETTISLKSSSSVPCVLDGYPGLQMLGPGGAIIPTTVVRKGVYSFTSMAPSTVTLTNGESASFNMGYSDVPTGNETSCPTSVDLQITPPNAYGHLTIAAKVAPCDNGSITVSPVYAGTGG